MQCIRCQQHPSQIEEYKEAAYDMEMSPESYVRMDEGTYHSRTDFFCCTSCYVALGAPVLPDLIGMYEHAMGKDGTIIPFPTQK
ncbi:hypothetical protein [Salimicrobium album]|uniref:CENP-V/GFA domain-containing protein n=1 Tax=Salimicrobium album TaxID=50717 RepID=A0A1H3DCE0_9BACI|nr:hypothetical protein [Salimicrobium album]SDX64172.1 hypothetical protein SAMN04488081_0914 [Salimicrobium album]